MFGWLLERLFVDRKGRAGRRKVRHLKRASEVQAAPVATTEGEETVRAVDPEREQLINEAMTIFRQRRAEYEKLDDGVRAKIDKAANKAFGNDDT